MRQAKACLYCRRLKRKCVVDEDTVACTLCKAKGVHCSFETRRQQRTTPQLAQKSEADDRHSVLTTLELAPDRVSRLVELYIYYIHDRPHSLFHLATLRRSIQAQTVAPHLLYALCAMGCRFSPDPKDKSLINALMAVSKEAVLGNVSDVGLERIQSLILLANLHVAHLDSTTETLFFTLAIRMMQLLQSRSTGQETALTLDLYRRSWCALYMADRWCSSGLGLPRQMDGMSDVFGMPTDEIAFQKLTSTQHLSEVDHERGLWAYMISLASIFGPLQDLNRRLVKCNISQRDADKQVKEIHARLENWCTDLPPDKVCTRENLLAHQRQGIGGPFVALHLGYYHYATLLYFQFLDTRVPQDDMTRFYATRCKVLAWEYSDFLYQSQRLPGCEAVYPTVAHMTIVASSVLLHTLLFGDEDELSSTRTALEHNFELLMTLKQYWPCLDSMIPRLVIFQQQCLESAAQRTHDLDPWMLRFLFEYALPLTIKPTLAVRDLSADSSAVDDVLARRNRFAVQALENLGSMVSLHGDDL